MNKVFKMNSEPARNSKARTDLKAREAGSVGAEFGKRKLKSVILIIKL